MAHKPNSQLYWFGPWRALFETIWLPICTLSMKKYRERKRFKKYENPYLIKVISFVSFRYVYGFDWFSCSGHWCWAFVCSYYVMSSDTTYCNEILESLQNTAQQKVAINFGPVWKNLKVKYTMIVLCLYYWRFLWIWFSII